ncbi:hypothetical protein [Streptomyces sp. NPDC048639]|uniref:hypothetical protein n=1 Tax=Streptomyces sp. NPDC048639 TaxID=3365581 RepID=UPI003721C582
MGQGRTLVRGARLFGAFACALLALIELMWVIQDVTAAAEPVDVWWLWAGMPSRAEGGIWGTSLIDPVLVCVHAVVAFIALQSVAVAPGALASAAVATMALRLPSLWMLQSDWMRVIDDDLRSRATLTAAAGVVIGAVLLVTVVAGRRPADYEPPSPRPGRGASLTACVLLATAALAGAAWQIHRAGEWGWATYRKVLVGDGPQNVYALLQPPYGWLGWTVVALSLAGAVAALRRTTWARALGSTAAVILLARGLTGISAQQRSEMLAHLGDLPLQEQLSVATALFETLAGFLVLTVLARRGERLVPDAGGDAYGYREGEPYAVQPPRW